MKDRYNPQDRLVQKGEKDMSLIEIAKTAQVPSGTMHAFQVEDKKILIANVDGKYYAINGICTHMGGDLSKGKLEGKIVTCPRHGAKFDVTTGKSVSGPKIAFLKLKTQDEPAYEVKVEGDSLKIDSTLLKQA
jgi:3-phenylpropionate/trans-cinnamate dioxygenase ferredoxin component